MKVESSEIGWKFLVPWVLAYVVVSIVTGYVGGPVVSVLQWLLLRKHLNRAILWVLASIGGWLLVGGIFRLLGAGIDVGLIPATVLSWGITGTAQWLVLRQQVHRAEWWIAASIGAGTIIAVILLNFLGSTMEGIGPTIFIFAAIGLVAGVVSGVVMVWLLRQPNPTGRSRLSESDGVPSA